MLVLSRKQGESVEFPELDVVVRVISLKKSKVQLGIEAPLQIAVSRGEIAGERRAGHARDVSRDGEHSDDRILDELARIEAELAALAELASAKDRPMARDLAADSIERLAGIKDTLHRSMRQRSEARPISDYIKVRADVIEQLRDTPPHSEDCGNRDCDSQDREAQECERTIAWPSSKPKRTSIARERKPGYAVSSLPIARKCGVA